MNKLIRCFICCFFVVQVLGLYASESFAGIWENTERFIEYIPKSNQPHEGALRIVLKTYYRFVYEDMGTYPVMLTPADHSQNIYRLHIRYPQMKNATETSVWVHKGAVFSSFYEKIPYTEQAVPITTDTSLSVAVELDKQPASQNILNGFWIERGHRKGILIYPQAAPEFLDAFFFMDGEYIKFRYWQGDLDYRQKQAEFRHINGNTISVPKLIQYSGMVYSCITSNGSKLKNYEKGMCDISETAGALQLTLKPQAGGPGLLAVGDTYPHSQYPRIENIPLYYDAADRAFSFGRPFLRRSAILDLQNEITAHNNLDRSPPEPLLKADELDFYWERIKQIREKR